MVQDAFVGLWRNASRHVPSRGSVRTWLLSIVHHRAIDAVRRRRPAAELPEDEVSMPASSTLPDVWAEVAGRLDRSAIVAAMATLSDPQREAIELAYYGGLTQQEIAARTGAPLGTVKSRVRLGLLALRDALMAAGAVDAPGAAPAAGPPGIVPAGQAGRAPTPGAGADPGAESPRPAGGGVTA